MLHAKPPSATEKNEAFWRNIWRIFSCNHKKVGKAFLDYHLIRRRYIVSRAATHFGKDKHEPAPLLGLSLLDVGCGTSRLAEEMTFRGAEVTALDVDVDALAYAKEQAKTSGAIVNFVEGNPDSLVQKGEKFDVILCMDLFEYVNHTSKLLTSLNELLTEDGIILFSSNNRTFLSLLWHVVIAQLWTKWMPKGTYTFRRFRSPKKLIGKMADKGLFVQEIKGVHFKLSTLEWERTDEADIRYIGFATKTNPEE